jgi:hypothetical protein
VNFRDHRDEGEEMQKIGKFSVNQILPRAVVVGDPLGLVGVVSVAQCSGGCVVGRVGVHGRLGRGWVVGT